LECKKDRFRIDATDIGQNRQARVNGGWSPGDKSMNVVSDGK